MTDPAGSSREPILHIATSADWTRAQESQAYDADSLATEGFIHCSRPHQVLEVAHRLFRGRTDLVLLQIDPARVEAEIRSENLEGGTELYPHVYGSIPCAAVVRVHGFRPDEAGRFSLPDGLSG